MTLTDARKAIADRLLHADMTGTLRRQSLWINRSTGRWWIGHDIAARKIHDLEGSGFTPLDWPNPSADIEQEALRLALRLKNEGVSFDPD